MSGWMRKGMGGVRLDEEGMGGVRLDEKGYGRYQDG